MAVQFIARYDDGTEYELTGLLDLLGIDPVILEREHMEIVGSLNHGGEAVADIQGSLHQEFREHGYSEREAAHMTDRLGDALGEEIIDVLAARAYREATRKPITL